MTGRIRAVAHAVIRDGDRILVSRGRDSVKDETFYRPLGGGIEFGELGEDAIRRELGEELGVEVASTRYLGTLENIFEYEGEAWHELVRVYEVELAGALPPPPLAVLDSDGEAVWVVPERCERLYPDGLRELLSGAKPTR